MKPRGTMDNIAFAWEECKAGASAEAAMGRTAQNCCIDASPDPVSAIQPTGAVYP